MITIGEGLRAYLLADVAIAALVCNAQALRVEHRRRIYPLRLPQNQMFPAITYQRISDPRGMHLRGTTGLARPRFQVDYWDTTHLCAAAGGALCRVRLAGFAGTFSDGESQVTSVRVQGIFPEDERDLFEEEINGGICRHSADYFLFHGTAENTV